METSLIEDIAKDAVNNISSNPPRYVSLLLYNGSMDTMDRIYDSFSRKLIQNSKHFSLIRANKRNDSIEEMFVKKEQNSYVVFVLYDPDSHIFNTKKDIVSRSFSIDIGWCERLFEKKI